MNHFTQLLSKVMGAIGRIKGCRISKKDPAGLVQEIELQTTKGKQTVSVKQLYAALKEMKSFCFTLACRSGNVTLNGRGYGHHVGLCQWGAREMVRQGWDYSAILQFYYPGTTFMQLR
jgi:stage II sporulation protein D